MKEIRRLKCEDASEIQRELGYTHRAVEDLSSALKQHMASEEVEMKELRRERKDYRDRVEGRFNEVERKIGAVEKSTAGLKTYILVAAIFISLLHETGEEDGLISLLFAFFKLIG